MKSQSIPPLIPPDTLYTVQQINTLKTSSIRSNIFTDSILTIEDGTIKGLTDPTQSSGIANLNYLVESEPSPSGPNLSIQINDLGFFTGYSSLTYNGILKTDLIQVNTGGTTGLRIGLGTITNISPTTSSSSVVNKSNVDFYNTLNTSTLILNTSITYSANQMVNAIIYRDPVSVQISNTKFDTTANALSIIEQFADPSVGNSAIFYLKNITSSNDVYIYLKPGTGVTFNNSTNGITIPQNYMLKALIIIQSPTSVLLLVESVELSASIPQTKFLNTSMSLIPYSLKTVITNSFKNKTALFTNYYDDQALTTGPLSWLSILNGQVSRSGLTSNIDLFFPEPASFLFINSGSESGSGSGQYRFIVRNGDPTYSISLNGSNGWILDPNASFVIGPMKSMLLWLYLNRNEFGDESVYVYVIGRMDL